MTNPRGWDTFGEEFEKSLRMIQETSGLSLVGRTLEVGDGICMLLHICTLLFSYSMHNPSHPVPTEAHKPQKQIAVSIVWNV